VEENRGEIFSKKKTKGQKKRDSIDPGVSGALFLAEKRGGGKQGGGFSEGKNEGAINAINRIYPFASCVFQDLLLFSIFNDIF